MAKEPKIIRELDSRLLELEKEVFNSPPPSYEEFRHRQGQWLALTNLKSWVVEQIQQHEKDSEDE